MKINIKKHSQIIILLLFTIKASAQIDGNLLLGLTPISNTDLTTITNLSEGTMFYNTDEQKIYLNTSSGFIKIPSLDTNSKDFWSVLGNTGTNSNLNFLGTTDNQDLVLKANNEERLRISGTNQAVLINAANQFNNHPLVIKANGVDVLAFQTDQGITEWHWNLLSNGLNFVETGVADYRIFMQQGGNIGINTGTPTERLDIDGAIRIRNITTTTSDLEVLVTTATGIIQKRPFSDFSGNDGISKLNFGGRWTNTDTLTDLNITNVIAPIFGAEDYKDDGNLLYEAQGNVLTVKATGRYQLIANLSLRTINGARNNPSARIAVNGIQIGSRSASGYTRNASNHTQSSVHINEILNLTANDELTIVMLREASTGIVRFSAANESSFIINKLR